MTPYRYYRPGRPGWSRRYRVALQVVAEAVVFVGSLAAIVAILFLCSWVPA